MKEIKVYKDDQTGQLVTTSLDIAERFCTSHKDILNNIDNIIKNMKSYNNSLSKSKNPPRASDGTFTYNKIILSDYFIENTNVDKTGKKQKKYLITQKGIARLTLRFIGLE